MKKLILASASPGRKELLEKAGFRFTVKVSDYEEDETLKVSPTELVKKLSQGKARAVAAQHRDAIIIGADTLVFLGKQRISKPIDTADARKILRQLSNKVHLVITGFTVIDTKSKKEITKSVETKVYFRKLSATEIDAYIASGEPFGKAGAYGIQGKGVLLIKKIEGDYSNIAGLPVTAVAEVLKKFGITNF